MRTWVRTTAQETKTLRIIAIVGTPTMSINVLTSKKREGERFWS
jgi:hypothetical protein